jgi:hypothetical protein
VLVHRQAEHPRLRRDHAVGCAGRSGRFSTEGGVGPSLVDAPSVLYGLAGAALAALWGKSSEGLLGLAKQTDKGGPR